MTDDLNKRVDALFQETGGEAYEYTYNAKVIGYRHFDSAKAIILALQQQLKEREEALKWYKGLEDMRREATKDRM